MSVRNGDLGFLAVTVVMTVKSEDTHHDGLPFLPLVLCFVVLP